MYAAQVEAIVNPLLEKDYFSIDEIEADLLIISNAMVSISSSTIPPMKSSKRPQGKHHIRMLSHVLAVVSQSADSFALRVSLRDAEVNSEGGTIYWL